MTQHIIEVLTVLIIGSFFNLLVNLLTLSASSPPPAPPAKQPPVKRRPPTCSGAGADTPSSGLERLTDSDSRRYPVARSARCEPATCSDTRRRLG